MNDQHELYEYARSRVKSKKRLYVHFVLFVIFSVCFFIANKILLYGAEYDWYIGVVVLWFCLLMIHTVNVYIINRFMGKEWERKQTDKLIALQKRRISELETTMQRKDELNTMSEEEQKVSE
jgi:uncharacterized membrane protein